MTKESDHNRYLNKIKKIMIGNNVFLEDLNWVAPLKKSRKISMSKTIEQELKPCPFCACADIAIHKANIDEMGYGEYISGKENFYCKCSKCGCHYGWGTKEEAIKAWNTRKPPVVEAGEGVKDSYKLLSNAMQHIAECFWTDGEPYKERLKYIQAYAKGVIDIDKRM